MSVDRLLALDDEALGARVGALDLAWPPPPDVVAALRAGVRPRRRPRRRWALLIAAALLLLAAAAVAARLIVDLGAIRIERIPPTTAPPEGSPARGQDFGHPMSLAEATAAAGFAPVVPPSLGPPDRVWLSETVVSFEPPEEGVMVTLAWRARPGLPRIPGTPYGATLMQFRGDADVAVKLIAAAARFVPERQAFWIVEPHQLELLTTGTLESFVVSGHTLVWQAEDRALRLETDLPLRRVLRLAFG